MKFYLVDRIERIEPGKRIVGVKALSLAEEYLADHFPAFPVLPGVLMLEAMVQTAAWLLRLEQNWSKSIIDLSSARNIRYGNFVAPGSILRVQAELVKIEGEIATFKGAGTLEGGQQAVSGRLELRSRNVADIFPPAAAADARIIEHLKQRFQLIGGPGALAAAAGAQSRT